MLTILCAQSECHLSGLFISWSHVCDSTSEDSSLESCRSSDSATSSVVLVGGGDCCSEWAGCIYGISYSKVNVTDVEYEKGYSTIKSTRRI